jgi:hypothetical protein
MDQTKNLIIVSYISGAFGSSLVNLLSGSPDCHGQFRMFEVGANHWHKQPWTFDPGKYNGGFIDDDTVIEIPSIVDRADKRVVGQFHNMNVHTLKKHFPQAKIIMLDTNKEQFNYALHRWWKVIGFDQKQIHNNRLEQISAAFDVIAYNTSYYANTKIITDNTDTVLTVKFDATQNRMHDIEQFLGIQLVPEQIQIYKAFVQKQLDTFYCVDDNFMFAWQAFDRIGVDAPIVDLAKRFENTYQLQRYSDEQK